MWRHMRRPSDSGPVHQRWPKIQRFPLRGRGGTSQRNRALVTAAALGIGGTTLAAGIAYGNYVPILRGHLRSANYSYPSVPGGVVQNLKAVGHSHRIAGEDEVGAFRSLSRWLGPRRVRRLFTLEKIGPGVYELPAGSVMTRAGAYMRKRLGERIEQGSLWNLAGRGNLQHAIERGTKGAKSALAKHIPRKTRPVRKIAGKYLGKPVRAVEKALRRRDVVARSAFRRAGRWLEGASWKGRAAVVGGVVATGVAGVMGIQALRRRAEARA